MSSPDLRTLITSAPMSASLIAVNLAVFLAVRFDGRLLAILALPPDWTGVGEQPWTLATAFVTAEVLLHLAVSALAIAIFGPRFERAAGSVHVLVVYLLAGLAGSLAIVATATTTGLHEPSVGASAAVLGLVGALAASPRDAWGAKLPTAKIVIVVLVMQLAPVAGIGDWASSVAHLVGLAVGAGYGYLLRPRTTSDRREPIVPAR